MDEDQFYTSNNIEKYPPDGKFNLCKKCLTMHVNNWDPLTFLYILEEADVPFIPDEWNRLLESYGQDLEKMTGMTILGRYLSKMKLKQYRSFRWVDSERLRNESQVRKRNTMEQSGYTEEQIEEVLAKGVHEPPEGYVPPVIGESREKESPQSAQPLWSNAEIENAVAVDITDDEKKYLMIKWGPTYTANEWVQLEKMFEETMNSFDIQTPNHIDYLKLICKTSLRAHKLIDIGDVEGFQKMSRVYDALNKSAKFTAAQNKAESGEFVDSVAELVLLCEKQGFIPKYYIEKPNDKVDATLADLKGYTRALVTEEMNLGALIEKAMDAMAKEDSKEDLSEDDENLEDIVTDTDYEDHQDFLEGEAELDEDIFRILKGEDRIGTKRIT